MSVDPDKLAAAKFLNPDRQTERFRRVMLREMTLEEALVDLGAELAEIKDGFIAGWFA